MKSSHVNLVTSSMGSVPERHFYRDIILRACAELKEWLSLFQAFIVFSNIHSFVSVANESIVPIYLTLEDTELGLSTTLWYRIYAATGTTYITE